MMPLDPADLPTAIAILGAALLAVLLTLALTSRRHVRDLAQRLAVAEAAREDAQQRLEETGRALAEEAALAAERARGLADLTQHGRVLAAALETERAEGKALAARLAVLEATLAQERRQHGETVQMLRDDRETLAQRFQLLADEATARQGATLSRQNKEQIDATLAPLQAKIVEFQQGLQTAHTESEKERARLSEQIRQLTEASAKMTSETQGLAEALRGRTQMQGAWGEMILSSILEKSGLRAGEEYVLQQSHVTEEGRRLRPDAIVRLPGRQSIVIDSKVSLVAFAAYVNAATDAERAPHLARHVAAIRAQIRDLAGKAYQDVAAGSLDYVVMFIPIEGALAVAVEADPALTHDALQGNVCLATPTTLMIALRTAANVWSVERRNRNAEVIAERAGRLHDKLAAFVADMQLLGERLTQARNSYDAAMQKFARGNGNALRQLDQLRLLGAKTSRQMPTLFDDEEVAVAD